MQAKVHVTEGLAGSRHRLTRDYVALRQHEALN